MFGKKPNGDKHIGSLIGAGSTLVGDLTFTGGLRIDGTVQGSVRSVGGDGDGLVMISEIGAVEGEVWAKHLVVAGRITGSVHATDLVELQPTARVTGDLHYRALEIRHGAAVEGRLVNDSGVQEVRSTPVLTIAAAGGAKA